MRNDQNKWFFDRIKIIRIRFQVLVGINVSASKTNEELQKIWNIIHLEHCDYYGDPESNDPQDEPPELEDEWLTDEQLQHRRRRRNYGPLAHLQEQQPGIPFQASINLPRRATLSPQLWMNLQQQTIMMISASPKKQ